MKTEIQKKYRQLLFYQKKFSEIQYLISKKMKQEKIYCVYIMASYRNGTLYIGITSNPQKRIYEHKNNVIEGFTKKYQVHLLVHLEIFNDPYTAISREK